MQAYNAKATFYITGNNLGKGKINDPSTPWPALIKVRLFSHKTLINNTNPP